MKTPTSSKNSPWLALKESLLSSDQRPGKDWLTIEEVAAEMKLHPSGARIACGRLLALGKLERQTVGKRRYYRMIR